MRYCIFTLLLFISLFSYSQDRIATSSGEGIYELYINGGALTPEQAIEEAKRCAIEDAIRKTGTMQVTLIDEMTVSSEGDFYSSKASIVTKGQIIKISKEQCTHIVKDNKIVYKYTLDAKVKITDTKPDYSYKAIVEPDKQVCYDGDCLNSINVNVAKDSYVYLFQIDKYNNVQSTLLNNVKVKAKNYTNIISGNRLCLKKDSAARQETMYFAAVFTKDDIPFDTKGDADLLMWMNTIPADRLCFVVFNIIVKEQL